MRFLSFGLLASAMLLPACERAPSSDDAEPPRPDPSASAEDYRYDPESRRVVARHTDSEGAVVSLSSGEDVPVLLPEPFLLFPDAEVTNTTQIARGDGRIATVDFVTSESRADVVKFYREIANRAGIDPDTAIDGDTASTLAGSTPDGETRFALSLQDASGRVRGQLTVTSRME